MKKSELSWQERALRAMGGMDRPLALAAGMPRLEAIGCREIVVENHKGILEYGEEEIRISCGDMLIRVEGSGLQLKTLSLSELSIQGEVRIVEYIRQEG